jgi:NAD(P)-dependent dehydrogenase (short-subunit alcohol dehydrogenase family)
MKLRHPRSGALYTLESDGLVKVEDGDAVGFFHADGRYVRGELRSADPHFTSWVGGPQLAPPERPPSPRHSGVPTPTFSPPRARGSEANRRSPDMDLGLSGKKALVTGASRGIGLAIARAFAEQGADVAICARAPGALESARKDLEARGAKVFAKSVDVADGAALAAFVEEAGSALGGLDVFVANASAGAGTGDAAWQAGFEIDLLSAARGVQAALPRLTASDAGSIVFISSTAALEYLGVPQPYNAMKAALIAHAHDLSQSLARSGVRVNVVSPGPIYFEGGNWQRIEQTMPGLYKLALAQCAIGRMGTPEEVARVVVFLASPAASLVTGANLVVDGGFTKGVHY